LKKTSLVSLEVVELITSMTYTKTFTEYERSIVHTHCSQGGFL